MRNILDDICAKAPRNSLLEQLPTELLLLVFNFVLDDCTGTWFHLRLVSCLFFSLLDHAFVKLFSQIHLKASEVSLSACVEWARSNRLRSYFHGFTLCYDVPDITHDTSRFLLHNSNIAGANFLLEELDRDDELLVNYSHTRLAVVR
jgi:hypothetical protein